MLTVVTQVDRLMACCTPRFSSTQACTLLVLWQYFQISSVLGVTAGSAETVAL